jgi:hypothetical protein
VRREGGGRKGRKEGWEDGREQRYVTENMRYLFT